MAMSLAARRAAYADEYKRRWHDAKLDPNRVTEALQVADQILAEIARYQAIVRSCGSMPWWMAGALHYRESSLDFTKQMHNGDSLKHRTVNVPAGRPLADPANGKSYTFEESAIDAFTMPGKHFEQISPWDIVEVLFRCELYNGFGYRSHGGEPSPYLFAGTNQSDETGKFVYDGHYSSTARESQLGVVAIMLALQMRGVELFPDQPMQHEVLPEIDESTVRYVQTRLRALGYFEVGNADGKIGKKTNSGVSAFRDEHGLGLSTVIDDEFLAALAKAGPRKVSEERATADASALRADKPALGASFSSKVISAVTGGGAAAIGIGQGIMSNLSGAQAYLAPMKELLGDIPGYVWAGLVVMAALTVYLNSRKAETEVVSAYREGSLQ